jgi:hypothetical protein
VIDGGIALGEHSPQFIAGKAAKECLTLFEVLFDPVIEIISLSFHKEPLAILDQINPFVSKWATYLMIGN